MFISKGSTSNNGGVPFILKQGKIHMIFDKMLRRKLRPWSVLLHLWSLLFSKLSITYMFCFIFNTFFPSLKHSFWFTKRSVSFSKRFVLYRSFKSYLTKSSVLKCYEFIQTSSGSFIVIIKMANWHRSQKLTPFIWRIILLLHISGPFSISCTDLQVNFEFELHLQVRQVFSSMIKSGTYILGRLIECNNCLSSMYLYVWGKIRVT